MPGVLVFLAREHQLDAVSRTPAPHAIVPVAFVARKSLGPRPWPPRRLRNSDTIHYRLDADRFVYFAGSRYDRQRQASTASHQVELADESASRAARSVFVLLLRVATAIFFEGLAAARFARTYEPLMHRRCQSFVPSASSRMCKTSRM